MDVIFVILSIFGILASSLNAFHFLENWKKTTKENRRIKIFFVAYHSILSITLLYYIITDVLGVQYMVFSLLFSLVLAGTLLGSIFMIQPSFDNKLIFATFSVILCTSGGVVFLLLDLLTTYEIQTYLVFVNVIIQTISLFLLLFYLVKAPKSPLFGFFISQLIMYLMHLIMGTSKHMAENTQYISAIAYITINIIMYLGYNDKFKFIEKKKVEN